MDFRTHILPHRDRLYRLALSMQLQPADAEDVVQDTMLRAWERRADWPSIDNMEAWLTQICKHAVLDRRKRPHHQSLSTDQHPTHPTTALKAGVAGNALATGHAGTEAVEARESLALIGQLISQLQPPLDELVRLRDIEGLSYQDIGQRLQLSESQVRVYLHRARASIKAQYAAIQGFGL